MPAGRTSEYNETICNYILELIDLGRSVKSICDEEDMPNRTTFYRSIDNNEELVTIMVGLLYHLLNRNGTL